MTPAPSPLSLPGPPESPTNPVSPPAQVPALSMGVPAPPQPKGTHMPVSGGNNRKAAGAVGLPGVGPAPRDPPALGDIRTNVPTPRGQPCQRRAPALCPQPPSISRTPKPTQAPPDAPSPCTGGVQHPPDRARWPRLFLSRLVAEPPSPAIQGGVTCPRVPHFRSPKRAAATGLGGIVTSTEQPARLTRPAGRWGRFAHFLGTLCDVCVSPLGPYFSIHPE